MQKSLTQIWDGLNAKGMGSDKGSVHSYLPVYEKLFRPYRNVAKDIIEIGVFNGDSMRLWDEYFEYAVCHGVECSETPHDGIANPTPRPEETWLLYIMDAENCGSDMARLPTSFDIILEDAGHDITQQLNLHRIWSKYVRPGGLYIIEDIQDIDRDRHLLEPLGEIIDLRHVKGRYDDVLVICKM